MDVFVYGTLTNRKRATDILDALDYRGSARLHGLHRQQGQYPTLGPGGHVDGRLLSTPNIAALDKYEGIDQGLYIRVSIPRTECPGTVETYIGDPDALGVPASWPGDGPFEKRVRRYIDERDVSVSAQE